MEVQTIGKWSFTVSEHREFFSRVLAAEACGILERWRDLFPAEETWVRAHYGVPSLIVRLDCVVLDGMLSVYEIEERPAGIGIAKLLNPEFLESLERLRNEWPAFSVTISPLRSASDDSLWVEVVDIDTVTAETAPNQLFLVRAEPDEAKFHALEPRSVSSLRAKGAKGYGVGLGWWQEVQIADADTFPWGDGFALKPIQGSKCHDVVIWYPDRNLGGISTRTAIRKTLVRNGRMYLQRFIRAMRFSGNGLADYCMIYRAFFGYSPKRHCYEALGGVWNARKNQQKIHGSSDSAFGPLVIR